MSPSPQRPLPTAVVGLGRHLEGLAQLPQTSVAPGGLTAHLTDLPGHVGRSDKALSTSSHRMARSVKARSKALSLRSLFPLLLPDPCPWSAQYPPGPPHITPPPSWGGPQNGRPLGPLEPCPIEARPRPPSAHRRSFAQVDHDPPQLGPLPWYPALRTQLPPSPLVLIHHPSSRWSPGILLSRKCQHLQGGEATVVPI